MPAFRFHLDVRDPPVKVIGAMVDFSERRPEIWPNLAARLYRVHELGPGTADVTEGTAFLGLDVWERVTYEWTDSVVRSVITDGGSSSQAVRSSFASALTTVAAGSTLTTTGGQGPYWDGASARCCS